MTLYVTVKTVKTVVEMKRQDEKKTLRDYETHDDDRSVQRRHHHHHHDLERRQPTCDA